MPQNDRIISIVASIVRIILSAEDRAITPDIVFDALVVEGHSPSEIMQALGVLSQVFEQFSGDNFHFSIPDRLRYRNLVAEEALRLTDEARDVLDNWKQLSLPSPEETEEILDQVVTAGPGEVDAANLFMIARNVAKPGTPFALLLSEQKDAQ